MYCTYAKTKWQTDKTNKIITNEERRIENVEIEIYNPKTCESGVLGSAGISPLVSITIPRIRKFQTLTKANETWKLHHRWQNMDRTIKILLKNEKNKMYLFRHPGYWIRNGQLLVLSLRHFALAMFGDLIFSKINKNQRKNVKVACVLRYIIS